jgi:hypothetical protein
VTVRDIARAIETAVAGSRRASSAEGRAYRILVRFADAERMTIDDDARPDAADGFGRGRRAAQPRRDRFRPRPDDRPPEGPAAATRGVNATWSGETWGRSRRTSSERSRRSRRRPGYDVSARWQRTRSTPVARRDAADPGARAGAGVHGARVPVRVVRDPLLVMLRCRLAAIGVVADAVRRPTRHSTCRATSGASCWAGSWSTTRSCSSIRRPGCVSAGTDGRGDAVAEAGRRRLPPDPDDDATTSSG